MVTLADVQSVLCADGREFQGVSYTDFTVLQEMLNVFPKILALTMKIQKYKDKCNKMNSFSTAALSTVVKILIYTTARSNLLQWNAILLSLTPFLPGG